MPHPHCIWHRVVWKRDGITSGVRSRRAGTLQASISGADCFSDATLQSSHPHRARNHGRGSTANIYQPRFETVLPCAEPHPANHGDRIADGVTADA